MDLISLQLSASRAGSEDAISDGPSELASPPPVLCFGRADSSVLQIARQTFQAPELGLPCGATLWIDLGNTSKHSDTMET